MKNLIFYGVSGHVDKKNLGDDYGNEINDILAEPSCKIGFSINSNSVELFKKLCEIYYTNALTEYLVNFF